MALVWPERSGFFGRCASGRGDWVVTALHHIANGEVWPIDEIARQALLAEKGAGVVGGGACRYMRRSNPQRRLAAVHRQLPAVAAQLAACGIDTVRYNFMPILDWTRTDLAYPLPDGPKALRFDQIAFAAFELHILQRAGAEADYTPQERPRRPVTPP